MVETLFIGSAFSVAAFFVWLVAVYFERRKAQVLITEARSHLKLSEDRTSHLRAEMSKLKDEVGNLHKNIQQEQRSKTSALEEMQKTHQASVLKRTLTGGLSGFVIGSIMMGLWFNAQAKIDVLEQVRDSQILAKVSEVKLEMIAEQNKALKEKNLEMEKELLNLRHARAVSLTKLEMLLEHIAPKSEQAMSTTIDPSSQLLDVSSNYAVNTAPYAEMVIPSSPAV